MNSNCPVIPNSASNTFPSNPDITGIGNRTALYASTLVGIFMTLAYPRDLESFRDAARTAMVTSTSMIIAVLYAWRSPNLGLSLVDAQIITMLIFLITSCYYSAATELNLGRTTRMASLLHGILSSVFGIIVYSHVDSFGGVAYIPDCPNSQFVFVIFGASISATNFGLQIFALIVFSFLLGGLILHNRKDLALFILRCIVGENPLRAGSSKREKAYVAAGGIVVIIYLIATTEEIINRNNLRGTVDQWTFGQTLSMLMLLDQILKAASRIRGRHLEDVLVRQAEERRRL